MSNQDVKYNDQHTTGMGYLNRARTVTPNKGKSYESVSLTGIGGRVDSPVYTYYDCSSVIGKALPKYLLLKEAINNPNHKVLVRFKLSDGLPDSYLTKDKKTGKEVRRHVIRGRLLNITWASINGQEVQFELDGEDEGHQQPESESTVPVTVTVTASDHNQSLFDDDELDEFVKLDRDDPKFLAKKAKLKSIGYRWDSNEKAWFKPAA